MSCLSLLLTTACQKEEPMSADDIQSSVRTNASTKVSLDEAIGSANELLARLDSIEAARFDSILEKPRTRSAATRSVRDVQVQSLQMPSTRSSSLTGDTYIKPGDDGRELGYTFERLITMLDMIPNKY